MTTATDTTWAEFSGRALVAWAGRHDIPVDDLARVTAMLTGHRRADRVAAGHSQCPDLTLPGLTARRWHDPVRLPWTAPIAHAYPEILAEVTELAANRGAHQHSEADKLASAGEWRRFELIKLGIAPPEARRRCPRTVEALESVPEIAEHGAAYFAIAAPGTRIVPHYGPHNARLRVHLGLRVPTDCWIEVGGQRRTWTEGECIVFDDSFEHSVGNDGDADRIVLIFDVWHPELSAAERGALTYLLRDLPLVLPSVCELRDAPTLLGGDGR